MQVYTNLYNLTFKVSAFKKVKKVQQGEKGSRVGEGGWRPGEPPEKEGLAIIESPPAGNIRQGNDV